MKNYKLISDISLAIFAVCLLIGVVIESIILLAISVVALVVGCIFAISRKYRDWL